jgi:hypothetical protein
MYELKVVRERREGYGALRCVRNAQQVYDAFRERFDRNIFPLHTERYKEIFIYKLVRSPKVVNE